MKAIRWYKAYNYAMFFISLIFSVLKLNGDIITPSFFSPVFMGSVSQSLIRETENTLNI